MKKIFLSLIAICLFAFSGHSQDAVKFQTVLGDTVNTTASLDTVFKTFPATAGYSTLSFQIKGTKISGTITAKAYLYVSNDGSTGSYLLTDSTAAFANAAGTQSLYFSKVAPPYSRYQIQVRQPGGNGSTERLAVAVYYVAHKYDQSN